MRFRRPQPKHSYAQTGEDLILRFLFEQLGVDRPSYLDVGAYHPYDLSNTALLYLAGSRGINVEPNPDGFRLFERERPQDVNLNMGVAPEPGELTFYCFSAATLNTFSAEGARETEQAGYPVESTLSVPVQPVPTLLERHFDGACPDLLSLDAEGLDLDILRSIPDWPGQPVAICIETVRFEPRVIGPEQKVAEIAEVAAGLGYVTFADTFVNTIFVRRDAFVR